MANTPKQQAVLEFCYKNGEITKQQAMSLINDYYYNGAKHVGDVLSRMVNSGLLKRVKPGVFQLGNGAKKGPETLDENQLSLF